MFISHLPIVCTSPEKKHDAHNLIYILSYADIPPNGDVLHSLSLCNGMESVMEWSPHDELWDFR